MKRFYAIILAIVFTFVSTSGVGQTDIGNKRYLKTFLKNGGGKNLLILGENHGSGATAKIYPSLVKYLNKNARLNTLLIEFGPAEAYFYTKYLETGNEKHLNYTLYAGAVKDWREVWRTLYRYNKTLKEPLKVIGIDFDRTRTLAYALFSIFMKYDNRPHFLEPLLSEIQTDSFYRSYTIGYPNKKDIEWANRTKDFLKTRLTAIKELLNPEDFAVITMILENQAVNYAEGREIAIAKNTQRIIERADQQNFLLLIGRNHAYLEPLYGDQNRLAKRIIDSSSIRVLTGVFLYENGSFNVKGKAPVILHEVSQKAPWKRFYSLINKRAKKEFTVLPLLKNLCPLARHVDYIILARDQKPYELLNPS